MRRKFLLATLTTAIVAVPALPAAALDVGDAPVSDALAPVTAPIVEEAPAEADPLVDGLAEATAAADVAVVEAAAAAAPVTAPVEEYVTVETDPIVVGVEGVGAVTIDPDNQSLGLTVEPLGIDEEIGMPQGGDDEAEPEPAPAQEPAPAPAAQPVVTAPTQQASTPQATPAAAPAVQAPQDEVRDVFPRRPRPVFAPREDVRTEVATPQVAPPQQGLNAAASLPEAGGAAQSPLLRLLALLMFGSTGYAWWFAKENNLA